ncbi:MAG TPA: hypothetical protein VGU71_03040 [Candidatus Dormibacteraeota bacterium]|nr:hypothetical protein [Candidatus Dormibacteraeota bacterium]
MNPIAVIAAKTVGAGTVAALLSLGVAGVLAQAASPNPTSKPVASAKAANPADRTARRAVSQAVFESEADVLGITPKALRTDLKQGQNVSDLAKAKGMTKEMFAANLVVSVRPRLEQLVTNKVITKPQADKVIDSISKGHIPFWNGLHPRKTAAPKTS